MESSVSANPTRDLSQTEIWFRDTLLKLLGWSSALIVLLAGWTLGNDKEEFSIQACSIAWSDQSCQRTMALVVGYPLVLVFWIFLVGWVRNRCPEHGTVPGKRTVYSYVAIMTALSLMVLLLLLLDMPTLPINRPVGLPPAA